jgi:hypothetical protein
MRHALTAAGMLIALASFALCAENTIPFFGSGGAIECRTWVEEHKDKASILAFNLDGWLLGFVSGGLYSETISATDREAFFAEMKEADVLRLTNDFCRTHPNAYMLQAALTVSADLSFDFARRTRAAIERAKRAPSRR